MSEPTTHDEPRDDEPRDDESRHRPAPARCVPAESLLAGESEVWIEYHGVRYLLRVTRRGRLILTK